MKITDQSLARLATRISALTRRLQDDCTVRWPVGSEVAFMFNWRQVVPTRGRVRWWRGSECGVELARPSRRGYQRVKRVHWSKLQEPHA